MDKDKTGETHRGYYWVYQNSREILFFDYQEGRGREGPMELLQNTGYLQADGFSARLSPALWRVFL